MNRGMGGWTRKKQRETETAVKTVCACQTRGGERRGRVWDAVLGWTRGAGRYPSAGTRAHSITRHGPTHERGNVPSHISSSRMVSPSHQGHHLFSLCSSLTICLVPRNSTSPHRLYVRMGGPKSDLTSYRISVPNWMLFARSPSRWTLVGRMVRPSVLLL
jgi:hypothetical protein